MPITRTHAKWGGAGVAIATAFLMVHEGYEPTAKHERGDPPSVITWCYGRTNYDDPTVTAGTHFSKDKCREFLADDLPKYAAPVQVCIPAFDSFPGYRQAALVSFAYNLGSGRLCKSAVAQLMNEGRFDEGCDAMAPYTRANGVELPGLVNRRRDEIKLCKGGH